MSDAQPIGPILDARGVRATIPDGALIADVVVITRVIPADGDTYVSLAWSTGMDWISRRGLIEVALDTERSTGRTREGDA